MLKVKNLRDSYIDYFKGKDHRHIHSSSLIPAGDPTLLFTTAGMVQFKPMFAGTVKTDYQRAVSIQKCLRTSDLENVGRTRRHCTFFEMLGNFSFGDYFKTEAIDMAWEFSVDLLKFDPQRLWVSIYQDDDEAFAIWNKRIGIPEERIVRLGKADNFWGPAGDSGACGPCSELYIDKGPEYGCGKPDCKPGCDCDRYMEYWNLVFNQFYQDTSGVLAALPRTGIDTGMGLERLATICQNVGSIFETDELKSLVDLVCADLGIQYEGKNIVPVNVIVEHSRALTFAMSDGAYPSNEGRGYVLRRILRRALRFARTIGVKRPYIYTMVDRVVALMGSYYPEIVDSAKNVKSVLEGEEKRFLETLDNGMDRLESIIKAAKSASASVSGSDAFVLYDTYGFPAEMTNEIAAEEGLQVDMQGFAAEMEKQRERGKQSWKGADAKSIALLSELVKASEETVFTGYGEYASQSSIVAMAGPDALVDTLVEGEEGCVVLAATPFYGESGGQAGDTGILKTDSGQFQVSATKKNEKRHLHYGKVIFGAIRCGETCSAEIDSVRRNLTKANHTVTHLLQAALRQVLGTHVKQAGSSVDADRMRFDFSHFEAMSPGQIAEVEAIVNRKIWERLEVSSMTMKLDDALKTGAMAEFGEKYGEEVRVIRAGDFSTELCGGTHVSNTIEIGIFKIVKESSPGAGTRRIEGITMRGVLERFNDLAAKIGEYSHILDTHEDKLAAKLREIAEENAALKKEIASYRRNEMKAGIDSLLSGAKDVNGISVLVKKIDAADMEALKGMADMIREKLHDAALFLLSSDDEKLMMVAAATQSAVAKGLDCGALIRDCAAVAGGKGGGRKDMAQAGAKDIAAAERVLQKADETISLQIKK